MGPEGGMGDWWNRGLGIGRLRECCIRGLKNLRNGELNEAGNGRRRKLGEVGGMGGMGYSSEFPLFFYLVIVLAGLRTFQTRCSH